MAEGDAERASGRGKVLTVFSSKGGAGRTTLTVNLAVALARQHPDQVVLVDLALTFGHAALFLDLQPQTSLAAMAVGVLPGLDRAALERYLLAHASTLRVLPGSLRPEEGESVTQEHVQHLLGLLRCYFGYVVIDTSPSFADATLVALEEADRIVYLLTPELAAVRDVRQCQRIFADVMRLPADRLYYLLNSPYGPRGLSREELERGFGRAVDGELPHGGDVPAQAAARGQPFIAAQPNAPIAQAVDRLARELAGAAVRRQPAAPDAGAADEERRGGPFSRLFGGR